MKSSSFRSRTSRIQKRRSFFTGGQSRGASRFQRRLLVESLEERRVLAVSILNGGGLGYAGNGGGGPPDETGAAGPFSYMEATNDTVTIFSPKAPGTILAQRGINDFFYNTTTGGNLTQIDPTSCGTCDSTLIFDNLMGGDGRFIIGDIDISQSANVSQFIFAVSTSSNPTTFTTADWNYYAITTTEGSGATQAWTDYPGNPGFNADAVVVTFNMAQGGSLTGNTQIVSINATDLANGVPQASLNFFRNDIAGSTSFRPTTMHDAVASDPMWLIRNPGNGTSIDMVEMTNVLSNSASFATTSLALPAANTFVSAGINNPLNPNSTPMNDIDTRFLRAGEFNDTVVATHKIAVGTAGVVSATVALDNMGNPIGGSGYTVGDTLTLNGGTGTAATLTVATLGAGGSVSTVTVATAGNYSSLAGIDGTVTGGSGSGAQFSLNFSGELDVQWYAIDVSGATPAFQLVGGVENVGRIGFGANTYAYEPGIDINSAGDIGLSFMESDTLGGAADSATGGSPSTFVTARKAIDPAGTMQGFVLVPAGTGSGNIGAGGTRIGDFSGLATDPVNGTFWAVNQFASGGGGPTVVANFTAALGLDSTHENITIRVNPLDSTMCEVLVTGTTTVVTTFPNNSPILFAVAGDANNNAVTIDESFGVVNTPIFFDGGGSPGAPGDQMIVIGTSGDDALNVTPTGASSADMTFDGSRVYSFLNIQKFSYHGQGGNDTMSVDSSGSLLGLSGGIDYDGGSGFDRLDLTQTGGPTRTSSRIDVGANPGDGRSVIDGQVINFTGLEPVTDNVPAATFTLSSVPGIASLLDAANAINYVASSLIAGGGRVTVDNFEPIEFSNKTALTIDAGAGSDEINLNNANTPTGLAAITIEGGDPTASDLLIANGTAAVNTITFTPTGADVGSITGAGPVPINFTTTEHVTINGQGGADVLTYQSPAGGSLLNFTPGATVNSGLVTGRKFSGNGGEVLVPMDYVNIDHSRALAQLIFANVGGHVDDLVLSGSTGSDIFTVLPNGGNGSVLVENGGGIPDALTHTVDTRGILNISLKSQGGDDSFNLTGTLPYTKAVVDADATVNLSGAAGPVTVFIGDNTPGSANPDTVITGYGAAVTLIGVDTANLDANAQQVTATGTTQNDNIVFTPTGALAGTFYNDIPSGNNLVPNTVFNIANVSGNFRVFNDPAGNADQVTLRGTAARDLIQINQASGVAQVLANNVTALLPVQLGISAEILNAQGLGGEDTFQVIPAPGIGGQAQDNLLINVDGGSGGENNALVVASSFGAAPGTLAANQFVVVNKNATPNSGTVRVFTAAVPNPDINYQFIQVVSPNVAGTSLNPNLLVMGPDLFEQNEQLGNAAFLGAGSTLQVQHATIFPSNTEFPGVPADNDHYRVVAQVSGTLDFQVYFRTFNPALLPGGGQINLQAFDAAGNVIAAAPGTFGANPGTGNARIRIPAVAGQTYYLRVFGATAATVNGYDITIIDTAPPVPYDIELDDLPVNPSFVCPQVNPAAANSDTGRSQFDNITCDATPTIRFRLDDGIFLHDLPGNPVNDTPPAGVIPIPFQAGAGAAGFRIAIFDEGTPQQPGVLPQVPLGFATQVAEGVYEFTTPTLTDGSHFLSARVQMVDPAIPQQTGFGDRSVSLEIVVDTTPPPVSFGEPGIPDDGVISDSDTGINPTNPDTLIDLVTRDTTPTFWGRAEADTIIRVYADVNGNGTLQVGIDVFLGQDTAIPLDGTNQEPDGFWKIESVVNLNDPDFFPVPDGQRTIFVTAEDVAGNVNAAGGGAGDTLDIFIDTQGPQITDVEINEVGNPYDLFDPKPSVDGPTPLVESIVISVQDLPARTADFLIAAIKDDIAENPGHYLLTGDYNGIIPIQDVIVTLLPVVAGQPARATIELVVWDFGPDGTPFTLDDLGAPLPDDRFTLFVNDEGIIDRAGNILDGESNADEPHDQDAPFPDILGVDGVPSGDGLPGGDFIARFTIDSVAEVGTWGAGSAWLDTNGNTSFDPTNEDFTNRDITYILGFTSDDLFAGNFALGVEDTADGFDKLAAYGRISGVWRWLVDTDNDGVPNINQPDPAGINGLPVAGNFDGNATNGDEVGLFTGTTWWLDTDHNFQVDTSIAAGAGFIGYPVVGDFDGDGQDDLGAWTDDRFKFDLSSDGLDGGVDASFRFGFSGPNERPVAADVNGDGFDDIGLFVPNRAGVSPDESAEWYVLVTGEVKNNGDLPPGEVVAPATLGPSIIDRIVLDPIDGQPIVRFTPKPFGRDIYEQYGDEFGLPILGNFDPPVTSGTVNATPGNNFRDPLDVNNDGKISAFDALLIVNHMNQFGPSTPVVVTAFPRAPYLDVTNNGMISPSDALAVINRLNQLILQQSSGAEGEADAFFSELGQSGGSQQGNDVLAMLADDLETQRKKRG